VVIFGFLAQKAHHVTKLVWISTGFADDCRLNFGGVGMLVSPKMSLNIT